jgi:SAM-dependent methyltransferase
MRGYNDSSYGDRFADVYDDWYGDVTNVAATVTHMASLVGPEGSVLELGIGTGRLAVPMADAGLVVTGVDSSDAMLAKLRERDVGQRVTALHGDMVIDLPPGPFDSALVAYNTIFNLRGTDDQAACFRAVASRLRPGGSFVVEAFVPDVGLATGSDVTVRSMTVDRVVLSVSQSDAGQQRAEGQFIEITESGGITLRPWAVRWATIQQLDDMALAAGMTLTTRTQDMAGAEFTTNSKTHVSTYQQP